MLGVDLGDGFAVLFRQVSGNRSASWTLVALDNRSNCICESLELSHGFLAAGVGHPFDGRLQLLDGSHHFVLVRDGRVGDALVLHNHRMGHALSFREAVYIPAATVVIRRMANVPARPGLGSPRFSRFRSVVNVNCTPKGGEGHAIEIKRAEEVGMCRHLWRHVGLSQEVECEFCLGMELVLEAERNAGIGSGKD